MTPPRTTSVIGKRNFGEAIAVFCVLTLVLVVIVGPMKSDTHFQDAGIQSNPYWVHTRVLLLLVICGYLYLKRNRFARSVATTRVVLLWMLWVVLTSAFWNIDYTLRSYLQRIMPDVLLWPLVYSFFYGVARQRNVVLHRLIVAFFCGLLFLSAAVFMQAFRLANAGSASGSLLNEVYYPLLLLPWVLSLNKRTWHYLGLTVVSVMVFYSMKRTALTALVTAAVAYAYANLVLYRSLRTKLMFAVGVIILGVGNSILFLDVDELSDYSFSKRLDRYELVRAGGRQEIFQQTLTMLLNSTPWTALVGHGQNAVSMDAPDQFSAHNDWLEVQYDFGVGGLLLYGLLHWCLIRKTRRLIQERSFYAPAFAASYLLFFCMSLTSHLVLYPTYFTFLTAFWGTVIGLTEPLSGLRFDIEVANQVRRRI